MSFDLDAIKAAHREHDLPDVPHDWGCRQCALIEEVERLRQEAEYLRADNRRYQAFSTIVSDLDRCEHGRHEGDVCGGTTGCNGPSRGNHLSGELLGWTISRDCIVVPERHQRHDPDAWIVRP